MTSPVNAVGLIVHDDDATVNCENPVQPENAYAFTDVMVEGIVSVPVKLEQF